MSLKFSRKILTFLGFSALLPVTACASRPMGAPSDPAFSRGLIDGVARQSLEEISVN